MRGLCGNCNRACFECDRNFRTSESLHSVCQVVRPPPSPTPTGAWQIVQNGVSAPQRMQPPGGRLKGRSRRSLHRCCSTSLRPLRHTMCGNRLTPPDTQPCDLCKDNDDVFPYMERSCVAACGRGVSRAAVGPVSCVAPYSRACAKAAPAEHVSDHLQHRPTDAHACMRRCRPCVKHTQNESKCSFCAFLFGIVKLRAKHSTGVAATGVDFQPANVILDHEQPNVLQSKPMI